MSSDPIPNTIELLGKDPFLTSIRNKIISGELRCTSDNPHQEFVSKMDQWVQKHDHFKLNGLNAFPNTDVIIGCHHYLDGLLIQHGINGIQVVDHDYRYYSRLDPTKTWAVPGELEPNTPLVIATPFPGYLGLHPDFDNLLDEAEQKNIDVHLDMAWLSASKGIEIDVNRPCIKSIGISLTKGYGASWNRVGIRYTKTVNEHDPITIFNGVNMCPDAVVRNGILLLENIPSGYLWDTYENQYLGLIDQYNLDVGNIIFAAYGKDRIIYSLSHLYLES